MNRKVSIIIPVYNGEKYVKEAIDSALNQTYKDIEIIVVNDGSTDNTDQICKAYGNKIRYFSKKNGGVSSALNLAIKNMKGDYFSWLSHDDLYKKDKIESQIKFLDSQKANNIILFSDYECMNSKGKPFSKPYVFDDKMLKAKPLYAILRGIINGITLLIPRTAFAECGYFNEELSCAQDYDLWWKMIKKYQFVHMNKLLTYTRIHQNQDTNTNPNAIKEGNNLWIKMIEDVPDNIKIQYEGSLYNYYYEMAKFLLTTPYIDAKDFCINKCMEIDNSRYLKKPVKLNKNIFKQINFLTIYLRNHGFKSTLIRIKKKLKKNKK